MLLFCSGLDPKQRHNQKERKRKEKLGHNIRKLWQLVPIEYHVSGQKEVRLGLWEEGGREGPGEEGETWA